MNETHTISLTFPLELERIPPSDRATIIPAWQVVVHIDGDQLPVSPCTTTNTGNWSPCSA